MAVAEVTEFSQVPLIALKSKARYAISQMLNATKVIPSPSGLPRDWRGLAHIAKLPITNANLPDPTHVILESWSNSKEVTFADLIEAFKELDRWDVFYDNFPSIESDAKIYLKSKEDGQLVSTLDNDDDKHILTVDDIRLSKKGLDPQIYDAFILYSDADTEFAMEIVNKLENDYRLKLCLKDRDLVGGLTFEHEAIMKLISERCNRLITVVSPSFLDSEANRFFLGFAQALGIEQRRRKIIPCIYETFHLPPQLSYYYVLNYSRISQICNFWEKLCQSVVTPVPSITLTNNNLMESVQIRELTEDEARAELENKTEIGKNWDCPTKVISKPSSQQRKKNQETADISTKLDVNQLCVKTNAEEVGASPRSKSPTVSLLKKLLPKPPSGRPHSTKTWFKKKKKVLLPS